MCRWKRAGRFRTPQRAELTHYCQARPAGGTPLPARSVQTKCFTRETHRPNSSFACWARVPKA